MSEPRYQHIARVRILSAVLAHGVSAKVIVVAVMGFKGPVQPSATEPLFLDVSLAAGATQTISLEPQHNAFVYVYEGAAEVGDPATPLGHGTAGVFSEGRQGRLSARSPHTRLTLPPAHP